MGPHWTCLVLLRPLLLLSALCAVPGDAKPKPPTALEAGFKARITEKFSASVEAAASHLASRLSLGDLGLFGGYELERGSEGAGAFWRHRCEEVEIQRDNIEYCALRQLQALTALCDVGARSQAGDKVVKAHLKALAKEERLSSLGIRKTKFDGVDIWFYLKRPGGSADDVDASPALQASALMALVRCADVVGERRYLQEAESWFLGLKKIYPSTAWNASQLSFHKYSIVWESMALVAAHVPKESSFHGRILAYVEDLEGFLRQLWEDKPESWSFSSARALALRSASKKPLKKRKKTLMRRWAQEHVNRFLGGGSRKLGEDSGIQEGILAKIGGASYTCGPLQGLASLAAVLGGAELVQVVLKLLEKDIDSYQISAANKGPWTDLSVAGADAEDLQGAFFRDEPQLSMEKRSSIRVDDVAQCVIALMQALSTLEGLLAVEVPSGGGEEVGGTGEGAPEGAEGREVEL